MPNPIEHATGLERRELEAIAAGNDVSILLKILQTLLLVHLLLNLFSSLNIRV